MNTQMKALEKIKYDGELNIAVGSSRMSKNWRNKTFTWSTLAKKLSVTRRTNETVAEYRKLGKAK